MLTWAVRPTSAVRPRGMLLSKSSTLTKSPQTNQLGREVMLLIPEEACLLLDQIKRDKGVWWMPWQQEAMKDVLTCDKPGGAGKRL